MADKQSREVDQFKYNEGDPEEVYTGHKPKSVGDLTVKVNVDVSEALVGLKSLQREAREATKALRELEVLAEKSPHTAADIASIYALKASEGKAVKSISDDICRSYGLADAEDGEGE